MSLLTPMDSFAHGLFPYGQSRRQVIVLKAYFDDSGTHNESDVIAMGGLIADEPVWALMEQKWAALRDELGIRKMHMSACENARNEFAGWSRDARDKAIARFSDIICDMNACMLAGAVSRTVWNRVASETDLANQFSQPIDFLFNVCMRKAMEAKRVSVEGTEKVVVTFDSREENLGFWNKLASGYQESWKHKVSSYAFGSMVDVLPLQAADMIAYEIFVHQCSRERVGGENPELRPNFRKLADQLPIHAGYFTYNNLLEYARELSGPLSNGLRSG
ncbi:MAG: DUF3800 domain-containing protein [Sphingomonas sp.]|nr:DUF3800 domain-containing protein [Sphingomonas sp.]